MLFTGFHVRDGRRDISPLAEMWSMDFELVADGVATAQLALWQSGRVDDGPKEKEDGGYQGEKGTDGASTHIGSH